MAVTASTSPKRVGKTPFDPPAVMIGDDVIHFPDLENQDGGLCVVMAVQGRCLSIMNLYTRRAFTGVRHRADPDLLTHPHLVHEQGCWDVAPKLRRIADLEKQVEILAAKVEKLEAHK